MNQFKYQNYLNVLIPLHVVASTAERIRLLLLLLILLLLLPVLQCQDLLVVAETHAGLPLRIVIWQAETISQNHCVLLPFSLFLKGQLDFLRRRIEFESPPFLFCCWKIQFHLPIEACLVQCFPAALGCLALQFGIINIIENILSSCIGTTMSVRARS